MLLQRCPYCGSEEESRSTATAARLPIAECTVCGRVVQERVGEVKELFIELAQVIFLPHLHTLHTLNLFISDFKGSTIIYNIDGVQ